jgi:hypothetical protein
MQGQFKNVIFVALAEVMVGVAKIHGGGTRLNFFIYNRLQPQQELMQRNDVVATNYSVV